MQSTRLRIVEVLRECGEATVGDLTRELDLAPATVRRHLDVLQRDGQVTTRAVRRSAGRPHFAFRLTEEAAQALPGHHMRLVTRLVEELLALREADTSGRAGEEVASLLFERLAQRLAEACQPRVTGRRLSERLPQTLEALAEEGLLFDAAPHPGGFILQGRACPCRRIPHGLEFVCRHNQQLLRRLLGSDVERADPESGSEACLYLVRGHEEGVVGRAGCDILGKVCGIDPHAKE